VKRLLAMFALLCVAVSSQAGAQQASSFIVSPLNHELTAQHGTTARTVISLQNKTNKPVSIAVTVLDFEAGPALDGQPEFLPDGNAEYGIANWFVDANVQKILTIPANQIINYEAAFRVPYGAADQTYFGAVRFTSADGTIAREALVFITIGTPKTSLAVNEVVFGESSNAAQRFGVFTATIENTGRGLSTPQIMVKITDADGRQIALLEQIEAGVVLPESRRNYTFAPASRLPDEQLTVTVSAVDQNGQTADKSIQLDRSQPATFAQADTDEQPEEAPWFTAMIVTLALLSGIAAVHLYRHHKTLIRLQEKKRTIRP
jgi:hypothetical protein